MRHHVARIARTILARRRFRLPRTYRPPFYPLKSLRVFTNLALPYNDHVQTTLINRTHASDTLGDARSILVQTHGPSIMRAILAGFAGVAPRSATQNLIELLGTLVTKYPAESRAWMGEVLFAVSLLVCFSVRMAIDALLWDCRMISCSQERDRTRKKSLSRLYLGTSFSWSSFI